MMEVAQTALGRQQRIVNETGSRFSLGLQTTQIVLVASDVLVQRATSDTGNGQTPGAG